VANVSINWLIKISSLALKQAWQKICKFIASSFKEQELVITALLRLSTIFFMAETSITTLRHLKVRELAKKSKNMVSSKWFVVN
ncbi:hypothetical protein GIB67_006041, partial [Kingdonia uniflora]